MFIHPIMSVNTNRRSAVASNNKPSYQSVPLVQQNDSVNFTGKEKAVLKESVNLMKPAKAEFAAMLGKLLKAAANDDVIGVFSAVGIKTKVNPDKTLTISHYCQPHNNHTFSSLGIDEQELMKNVSEITGDAIFAGSNFKTLHAKRIGGVADFDYSKVETADYLEYVKSLMASNDSVLGSAKTLTTVNGDLAINRNGYLRHLDSVVDINGSLYAERSILETMMSCQNIKKDARVNYSAIRLMPALEEIGGTGQFYRTEIEDLSSLRKSGSIDLSDVNTLKNLDNYEECTDDFHAYGTTQLASMNKFIKAKKVSISCTKIISLPAFESCEGDLKLSSTCMESMPKFKYCGGDVFIGDTGLKRKDFKKVDIKGEIVT